MDPLAGPGKAACPLIMFIVQHVKARHLPRIDLGISGLDLTRVPVHRLRVVGPNAAALALAGLAILLQPADQRLSGLTLGVALLLAMVLLVSRAVLPAHLWQFGPVIAADVLATMVLLWLTGAPDSPFSIFAFAGAWAAAVHGRPHGGRGYAGFLGVTYVLVLLPAAVGQGMLSEVLANVVSIFAVGELSDLLADLDPRTRQIADILLNARRGLSRFEVRRRLGVAVGDALPVDSVIAAGHLGLTAQQAELAGYLLLGLTNQEIADAASVSEATVKYRLTRLYRDLRVHGRAEAVERVRSTGLDHTFERPPGGGPNRWTMLRGGRQGRVHGS